MSEFGLDLAALDDLDFGTAEGQNNLARALARRLMTPRGGLFYDEDYGFDVRELVNESATDEALFDLRVQVAAEVEKDPRVRTAGVIVTDLGDRIFRLDVELETLEGPFRLALAVDQLKVEVLRANA